MSDVLVENKTCGKCGAEVRSDTQFCYNCGESVEPAAIPDASPSHEPQLASAASLRRKGRDLERKPVEVFWEPAENRANLPLIIATVVFVVFAAGVVLSALYYR